VFSICGAGVGKWGGEKRVFRMRSGFRTALADFRISGAWLLGSAVCAVCEYANRLGSDVKFSSEVEKEAENGALRERRLSKGLQRNI